MSHWEELLSEVVTTFYLPTIEEDGRKVDVDVSGKMLPFEHIRVVETFTLSAEARARLLEQAPAEGFKGIVDHASGTAFGRREVLYTATPGSAGGEITAAMRTEMRADIDGRPQARIKYDPPFGPGGVSDFHDINTDNYDESDWRWARGQALIILARFFEMLDSRTARYIEQPTSRQVRRSMGVVPEYREYIIIPRERTERYASALTRTDIVKRLKALHAVRGHLRHYKTGKTTFVRPHTRGQGEALQVRDYVVQP